VDLRTSSKNLTGFEIHQVSSGYKLCSMKFGDTESFFVGLLLYCDSSSSRVVFGLAVLEFCYVNSLTSYRKLSAVCVV